MPELRRGVIQPDCHRHQHQLPPTTAQQRSGRASVLIATRKELGDSGQAPENNERSAPVRRTRSYRKHRRPPVPRRSDHRIWAGEAPPLARTGPGLTGGQTRQRRTQPNQDRRRARQQYWDPARGGCGARHLPPRRRWRDWLGLAACPSVRGWSLASQRSLSPEKKPQHSHKSIPEGRSFPPRAGCDFHTMVAASAASTGRGLILAGALPHQGTVRAHHLARTQIRGGGVHFPHGLARRRGELNGRSGGAVMGAARRHYRTRAPSLASTDSDRAYQYELPAGRSLHACACEGAHFLYW